MAGKPKFYTDEQVPRAVVRGLRQRGADVISVPEAGMLGASDEEHLEWADGRERVLFTQDTDFLRLHARGVLHAGLVYAPQGTSISRMIYGLMLIHETLDADDMRGHVEFI